MKYLMILLFIGMVTVPFYSAGTGYQGYQFTAYVQKANGGYYREFWQNNRTTLKVGHDEEYSIVVKNPLPVRVAVAVSIDGLNSIDGKNTSLRNARRWIIEPYSSITVEGWQTGMKTLRKFVFTEQSSTYAQWKQNQEGKKYSRNLGVIGVAWSWNAAELENALRPPQPFTDDEVKLSEAGRDKKEMPNAGARSESKAGTGMGTQQQNYVYEVEFDGNAGMFSVKDVLKIYYEFAKEEPRPEPFVDDGWNNGSYAVDMYK